MLAALKHGRNSLGVELDPAYCQQAASRLLNENTNLFGNAQLQIDLKPQSAAGTLSILQEAGSAYKAARIGKLRHCPAAKENSG